MGVFYRKYVRKNRVSIFWIENKDCKTKKLTFLQGPKNGHFLKGLVHGVLSKNRTFSYRRFSKKFYQKTSFLLLWKEKNDFIYKKFKFLKGPKNGHFPKELLHGFYPKFEISGMGVFYKKYVTKNRFSIFWIENKHSKTKTIDVLTRAKKWTVFKGVSPWILSENRTFFMGVFHKNHFRKHRFLYCRKKRMILSRKKLKFYKRTKNGHFPRGLVNGFCPKIDLSVIAVFLKKLCQKRSFLDILTRKQSFADYKIEVLTRAKKWTFFEGVSPWILSKNRTFSYLPFSQKSYQERSFLILSKQKNDFK